MAMNEEKRDEMIDAVMDLIDHAYNLGYQDGLDAAKNVFLDKEFMRNLENAVSEYFRKDVGKWLKR